MPLSVTITKLPADASTISENLRRKPSLRKKVRPGALECGNILLTLLFASAEPSTRGCHGS
jgi:hypothetical protein